MKTCEACGKEFEELEELNLYINDEYLSTIHVCPKCAALLREIMEDEKFGEKLVAYLKELETLWEHGTKENTKVGTLVQIVQLKDEPVAPLYGRTGIVEFIDDAGQIHGTWGSLAILPDVDNWLVLKNDKQEGDQNV